MRISKKKKEIADKWCEQNGASSFDFENRDIYFYDGGLFSIENTPKIKPWTKEKIGKPTKEIIGNKKQTTYPVNFVPRHYRGKVTPEKVFNFIKDKIGKGETFEEEVLHFFDKEKMDYMKAVFWFEELDETINYLKRMKKMLNKIGVKTTWKKG